LGSPELYEPIEASYFSAQNRVSDVASQWHCATQAPPGRPAGCEAV
jgi:hypothetical protein